MREWQACALKSHCPPEVQAVRALKGEIVGEAVVFMTTDM